MSTSRISASSYSNTAPLIWAFQYGSQRGKYELILDNAPARSAELLRENRVDAALVPVIEYQRIDDVRLVADVCVGAREKVRSVCLVTKGEDLKDVRSVALDVSSKTSVALTKIIFREFLGFEPDWKDSEPNLNEMLRNADCALLIGDPALTIAADLSEPSASAGGHDLTDLSVASASADAPILRKFDLAEIWKSYTNFGFVFAMWMTRDESCSIDFAAARDEGLQHLEEIISNYETEILLTKEDFRSYLAENISYRVDDSMRKGLELYFALASKNGLIEKNKPLAFI